MEGQMSIFDFLEPEHPFTWHPIIDDLSKDIHRLFQGWEVEDEQYIVWNHVPNLGKRYSAYVDITSDCAKTIVAAPVIEKYKSKGLEISFSVTPCFGKHDYRCDQRIYIYSIWNTKGHKEP